MPTWRDAVLNHFNNHFSHLKIVTDPDGLLKDEKIINVLKDEGIEILEFQDRATFRFLFEKYFRGKKEKHVLIYLNHDAVDMLPYDVMQSGQIIELKISQVFPDFSHHIIQQLDGRALDALYVASKEQLQGSLSSHATCDFLLRKVYKLAYDIVETKEELIKLLLQKHDNTYFIPPVLEEFLIDHFSKDDMLKSLPIYRLVTSRTFFYQYLQNDWEKYINYLQESQYQGKEQGTESYYHQPLLANSESMKYVFNQLFLEGKLKPIVHMAAERMPKWTHVGIQIDSHRNYRQKVETLIRKIEKQLDASLTYKQWIEVARWFCEVKYIVNKNNIINHIDLQSIEQKLESIFELWMLTEFQTLSNLPYVSHPVMVHHIPHFLRLKKSKKKALIVLDGMSFIQWKQIEEYLCDDFHCDVQGSFAWVPTITSISRQAIFTGEIPFYFAETIHSTYKEPAAWQLYWEKESISKLHISYQKGLGLETYEPSQIHALQKSNIKITGMVIDTIDKLMHGAILGHKGMIAALDVWLQKGYLKQLLRDLLDVGFDIYITSDHGNQESIGIGRIQEGVLAETRGERVRIYKNELLRDQAAKYHSSIVWPNTGLPNDRFMLLAKSGEAFIKKGEQVVSHGGISLEEVIVPFVHITRKENIQ
ncbi:MULTISPECIES: BREX-3 system phosphatase PglZ [Brevibacillus]|uniref:BREX-3 system phosphatase PglZ n=1 Tax=Brevibacillus TaxID=55080 RepID=UPI00156ACC9E|nr:MULTISPECIES: BREX-3 system phosphatase PglZ [Brevibacillus]UED70184.1 BREX-3 system phosphatase PglZ [Brevibacillus sp. HD3.3A]WDV96482.1 BREX-3 system phosphatase PglZ [Brevibacillus parabrevis]